jgi:predicted nucleic acid-binding protein
MKIFLDTNIFVYALDRLSPMHKAATDLLQRVDARELEGHCSYQVLAELYTVITRKVARPLSSRQAGREVFRLMEAETLVKLPIDEAALRLTLGLARKHRISGIMFFDAQIVGTMLSRNIDRLYTANEGDFSRFKEIQVVNPFKAMATRP